MNCSWRGPRLRDVLCRAEPTIEVGGEEEGQEVGEKTKKRNKKGHVAFASFQTRCQEDEWYGASIELERAMREDAEVILALEVSGLNMQVLCYIVRCNPALSCFRGASIPSSGFLPLSFPLFHFLFHLGLIWYGTGMGYFKCMFHICFSINQSIDQPIHINPPN